MTRALTSVEIASAAIELALKDIAPRWKADTIAAYEKAAREEYNFARAQLLSPDLAACEQWFKRKMFRFVKRSILHQERSNNDYRKPFLLWREAAAQDEIYADIQEARLYGEHAYESAHRDFVSRGASKIADVFGEGSELKVDCELKYRPGGAIEGYASASSGAGTLDVVVSVITNYRYNENAADGVITVYGQYPMRVVRVTNRNGMRSPGCSLEEAALLISGRNPVEEKRRVKLELKVKKAARSEALWALEKQKRVYEGIAMHYRFNEAYYCKNPISETEEQKARRRERLEELCTKGGVSDPGSKKAANDKLKELREAMKTLKGSPL